MQFPVKNFFIHKKNANDEINFKILSNDNELISYLSNELNIKLLWDVCRVPDFQKIMNDNYIELLKSIFLSLMDNDLKIPESWLHNKVIHLDDYSGGIDELTSKISAIRTWTYISNQSFWLENNEYWKEKTKIIEDNLSDHLHESLTKRFVDFSASYFINTQNRREKPQIEIDNNKFLKLNGQNYGYINGFDLKLIDLVNSNSLFSLNHVKKTIRSMIEEKITDFINAPDNSINLGDIQKLNLNEKCSYLYWGDEPIGFLKKGENIFSPKVEILISEYLESDKKIQISNKLQRWIDDKIAITLKPIKEELNDLKIPSIRSIVFNLFNSLGTMITDDYQIDIKNFNEESKSAISKLGVRIGAKFFFMPNFLKKNTMELNALLWNIFYKTSEEGLYPLPKNGRVSFFSDTSMPNSYWLAIGYIFINNFAVRVDVFERIYFLARQKIKSGPFFESSDLMNPIGCNSQQLANLLSFCGFDNISVADHKKIFFFKQNNVKKSKKTIKKNKKKTITKNKKEIFKRKETKADPNSPFAVLQKLL